MSTVIQASTEIELEDTAVAREEPGASDLSSSAVLGRTAAQTQHDDRHAVVGHHTGLGVIDGPGLRS